MSSSIGQDVDAVDVDAALTELEDSGLLVTSELSNGMSRRRLLQVGGVAAAGVLVSSALVPALAAASTTCSISGLSQFGILIFDGTHYYFVTGGLAGANNGSTVLGGCSTQLGGNSGGNGSNGVCWHGLTSLPGPDGTQHPLASCSTYHDTINFTVRGSDLVYTLPTGTTLIGWWVHNGTVCAGPLSPTTDTTRQDCTYVTNPCNAI